MKITNVMKRILGILTRKEALAALLPSAAILGASIISGGAMFSPGDLNDSESNLPKGGVRSHADLERECAACHVPFWSEEHMQDRCIACHTEVAEEREIESSMHGFFDTLYTCQECHIEHHGATAPLTDFKRVVFPHQNVGFFLTAHRELPPASQPECQSCHPQSVHEFDVNSCRECHEQNDASGTQKHIDIFHWDCLGCHDGSFRVGAGFDHQQALFPLQGAHLNVPCEACHKIASNMDDLQSTPHECIECHAEMDEHAGQMGENCGQCHSPLNWQTVSVDHDLTDYPLAGAHISVQCSSCHIDKQWIGLDTACYTCHVTKDAHEGQNGVQCEICHQEAAWSETIFDHADTALPLAGGHAGITCESCHVEVEFAGISPACAECHVDPEFHAGYFGTECGNCHNADAWVPATHWRPHDDFPLNHGGGSPSCKTCHPSTLATYTCYGCHRHNPDRLFLEHKRLTKFLKPEGGQIQNFDACHRCHPTGRQCTGRVHCE